MATPLVYLVTGCSRGIGIEFTRQILARGDNVVATCRNPAGAAELQQVLGAHAARGSSKRANFGICLPLDISSEASVASLAASIGSLGQAPSIDVVIHNAGISCPTHPVEHWATATKASLMACFETNAVGPLLLTQALLPLLRSGAGKKIFFVSTDMASMVSMDPSGDYPNGTSVSYRASKSALNMAVRCLAGEHGPTTDDGFAITLCHPGWVNTDMGSAGDRSPPVTPVDSVAGMLAVVDSMGSHSDADFVDFRGTRWPW